MSILGFQATHVPEAWALPRFKRVAAFFDAVVEVFSDAQAMARAAQKRYPFIEF